MPSILIVDDNKPSVVMTSEIIKDHVQNVVVEVVPTGKDCLNATKNKTYDLVVIDFDLTDADGVTLAKLVRSYFDGPILITAFEDEVVEEAVKAEMYLYSDICSYIKKPIVTADFVKKIEKYLFKKESIEKKFSTNIPLQISKTSSTKGKKFTPVKGRIFNLSLSDAAINSTSPLMTKVGEEVSLTLSFKNSKVKDSQTKIKAQVVWLDKSKKKVNVKFAELNEKTMKDLERVLRSSRELE